MTPGLRVLWLAVAVIGVGACASSTRRGDEADADADGDTGVGACGAAVECDRVGFGENIALDTAASVVEASGDRIVLLGADGVPVTFFGCGLELGGVVAVGQAVTARNARCGAWSECWVGQILVEGAPVAAAASCDAEGEATPPLDALGWSVELASACEGATDRVCSASGRPVHLAVPETVHAATITTEAGARATAQVGESVTAGDWEIRLLDARTSEALDRGGCFIEASGVFVVTAARRAARPPCPQPPEVAVQLGLDVGAPETSLPLTVQRLHPDRVVLATAEGTEVVFGWHGPDPSRALSVGDAVVGRRYASATTGGGTLDLIEAGGRVALAASETSGFTVHVPDLSVLGLTVELGEPCELGQSVGECTHDPLVAQRYPLLIRAAPGDAAVAVEVGETAAVGPWQATLLEATQYPGLLCPDFHVEAWAPFGLTLMQEQDDG